MVVVPAEECATSAPDNVSPTGAGGARVLLVVDDQAAIIASVEKIDAGHDAGGEPVGERSAGLLGVEARALAAPRSAGR